MLKEQVRKGARLAPAVGQHEALEGGQHLEGVGPAVLLQKALTILLQDEKGSACRSEVHDAVDGAIAQDLPLRGADELHN
jgi:hypothetical protein